MSKKYEEDDRLKQLVEEQFIKEAEMMEEALFSDPDFKDYEMTDEEVEASYQEFLKRVEQKETTENKEIKEKNIGAKEQKIVSMPSKKKKRKIPVAKVAGIAALCVISVFAASMTGEANRRYVINSVRYLMGDDTRIVVSNDENNDKSSSDEYEAIADIENTLDVEVPEFMYRPEGFEFLKYEVDEFSKTARIEYEYKECIISLCIDNEQEMSSSLIDSVHGDNDDIINTLDEKISVQIKKIEDAKDVKPSYIARWKKNNVLYQLSGKVEKKLFYKIIEKIRY